ncbi:stage II sporulation protein M [Oceanobacillus sp. FSL H7-0719]|uniref:stage II sporulation protein M n=1 Tax=Oceanobacillus sp. FSL H7-0719 TaxID=2954507 RepID=UPI003255C6B4
MQNFRMILSQHLKNYSIIYLFMIILFLSGIIFGAVIVNSMNFVQKEDLFFYLERFFNYTIEEQAVDKFTLFKESFFFHLKYLALLFVLGLSIIGLPIIWILLFIKGLVVGFSVGFIVKQLGSEGLLFSAVSIAPHNFIVIPIYIFAGSLAMIFALALLKKIFSKGSAFTLWQPFFNYMISFSIMIIFSIGAAVLESYVSNGAMQYLIKSFYL